MPVTLTRPILCAVAACAVMVCPLKAGATGQMPDYLVIDGQTHGLTHARPFEPILRSDRPGAGALRDQLQAARGNCSALWRGYHGTWEVRDGALYLTGLTVGPCGMGPDVKAAVFPYAAGSVKATWVTGRLVFNVGTTQPYAHLLAETLMQSIDVVEGEVVGPPTMFVPPPSFRH